MLSIVHTTRCGKFLPAIPTVAYRVGMRTVTPLLAAGLAATLTLTISGCFGDTPSYNPAAEPTTAPLFASDEEALAAAEEAYRDYYAVSDQILNEGGIEPERLLEVATQEVFEFESESFATFRDSGYRSTGETKLDSLALQSYDANAKEPESIVVIYACVDVSNVDVLNAEGDSVVNQNGSARLPFEAFFTSPNGQNLILSAKELWTGGDFCES